MPLRAVLFDLDDTLIPEAEPLAAAYRAVASDSTQAQALQARAHAAWGQAPGQDYLERVQVSANESLSSEFAGQDAPQRALRAFLPRFHALTFGDADPAPLARWRSARMDAQTAYPGARELLHELRGRYRLGLVTNGPSDLQREKVARTALGEFFAVVVASCDLGTGKPEPGIFAAALEALGVTAEEAVMVGNDQVRDIAGARAAGLRAVWMQPGADARDGALTDLRALPARLIG